MSKPSVFIVESPKKAKTLKSILDPKLYTPIASVGHTHNLPLKDYVDIENNFELKYELDKNKKEVFNSIVELIKSNSDTVYTASDMDSEGSAIANNLWQELKTIFPNKTFIRVNMCEITKSGVQKALANSYPIDDPKELQIVDAAKCRRIFDRFIGFEVSPIAYNYLSNKSSAGRVQSPALRLVVEKEREINRFIPEEFYNVFCQVYKKNTSDILLLQYEKVLKKESESIDIVTKCKKQPATLTKIISKQTHSKASPPFITKTILASASTILSWKAEKTTAVLQSLFQQGFITYPRTDDSRIDTEAETDLINYISSNFSKQYIHSIPNYKDSNAKLEHSCIRVTNLVANVSKLDNDEIKLYNLIKNRFIASGLPPAIYESTACIFDINGYTFKINGSVQKFDGYTKIWDYNSKNDTILPILKEGDVLNNRDIYSEQKKTQPPSRFKDASLITALESKGIGKPSTYASILHLLEERKYVEYEKQSLKPTKLGMELCEFLENYFSEVISYEFTKKCESVQDQIAKGEWAYVDACREFYDELKKNIKEAKDKLRENFKEEICPICNKNTLNKRLNKKTGQYFLSCSGYKDESCKANFNIDENGKPVIVEYLSDCPSCDGKLIKRTNKKTGEFFYSCTNWNKKQKCKTTADKNGNISVKQEEKSHGKCPKCNKGKILEKKSKFGDFYGCSNFPNCKYTTKDLENIKELRKKNKENKKKEKAIDMKDNKSNAKK